MSNMMQLKKFVIGQDVLLKAAGPIERRFTVQV